MKGARAADGKDVRRNRSRFRLPDLLAVLLLVLFVVLSLPGLDRYPKIHEDESWVVSPGWTFVTTGRFATSLFTGFFGSERHFYGFLPVFPLLAGSSLATFGFGLFAARLTSLLLAVSILGLTHVIGRRLLSPWEGVLAASLLVFWPVSVPLGHLTSGIPIADLARIARYDVAVPAFGLLALFVFLSGGVEAAPSKLRLLLAGLLAGLAALSHVYGAVWLVALAVLHVCLRRRRALFGIAHMAAGFVLVLLPWAAFVASGWDDFRLQNFNVSGRFEVMRAGFYVENVLTEGVQLGPIAAAARSGRFTPWLAAASLVAGVVVLSRRARAGAWQAWVLLVALGTHLALFTLFLRPKLFSYLAPLWPLLALIAAAGLAAAFRARRERPFRAALVLLIALSAFEGARAWAALHAAARSTTSYPELTARLGRLLPPDKRILALHHYWLGLGLRFPYYQSFFVPTALAEPSFTPRPVPFAESAGRRPPDVVVLDPVILRFLEEASAPAHERHRLATDIRAFLAAEKFSLLASFDDPSYGRFEVWSVPAPH